MLRNKTLLRPTPNCNCRDLGFTVNREKLTVGVVVLRFVAANGGSNFVNGVFYYLVIYYYKNCTKNGFLFLFVLTRKLSCTADERT